MSRTRHQPSALPSADERDTTRQRADLAALRRMLEVSEGCFSLSFAVCNDRTLRNELIERLRGEFPGLVLIEVPPGTPNVHRLVRDHLSPCDAHGPHRPRERVQAGAVYLVSAVQPPSPQVWRSRRGELVTA